MGKLIGNDVSTSGVKKILNNYTKSYIDGTDEYSKFFESDPNFVTYFAIDSKATTVDQGLGGYIETVGNESPLRFNRIDDLPLFGVSEIVPQHSFDETEGLREDGISEAIIMPGTIQPQPNDHFVFSYHQKDISHLRSYRVTDVDTSYFHSKTYFKISFEEDEGIDISLLDGKQKVGQYQTIYKDIGSEKVAVIPESKYKLMKIIATVVDNIADEYIENYFDDTLNIFVFNDSRVSPYKIYDGNLHQYIRDHQVFINEKNFMANIFTTDEFNHTKKEYRRSLYGSLDRFLKNNEASIPSSYRLLPKKVSSLNSILGVYGGMYADIEWSDRGDTQFLNNNLNEYLAEFENVNSLTGLDIISKVFIQIIKSPETISDEELKLLVDEIQLSIGDSLEDYIIVPIILSMLEDYYNNLNTDDSLIYQDIN